MGSLIQHNILSLQARILPVENLILSHNRHIKETLVMRFCCLRRQTLWLTGGFQSEAKSA